MILKKTTPTMLGKTSRYATLLLPTLLVTPIIHGATNNKLQTILERAPFGPPPSSLPSEAELNAGLKHIEEEEEDTRPRLSETVRLSAMTRFNGVPAAGLIDLMSGRTFFLIEGQTLGGFRLEEVSFETSSVILTKDGVTEPVYLSFAEGQPTNLTSTTNGFALSISDQPIKTPAASSHTPQGIPVPPHQATEPSATYSPELIAAATITEPDGSTRLSFRELHRLRIQESREKAEREKTERDARAKLEREQTEKKAEEEKKVTEIAEQAEAAAEKIRRKQIIQAIKEGYDVERNFELTPEEAKELAQDGFDIAVDAPAANRQEEPPHD